MRIEHMAINVKDPVGMAKWHEANLGMSVVREGPPPVNTRFIADASGHTILEVYSNANAPVPDYGGMDPLVLHIAFMVDDVARVRDRLIASGAAPVGDIAVLPDGDELAMLRDPWGLAIQLVKRARPML